MLIPVAILGSIVVGFLVVMGAILFGSRQGSQRLWAFAAGGLLAATILNSWWLAVIGMAMFKLFVLREDT